jgi:hypothetical protein
MCVITILAVIIAIIAVALYRNERKKFCDLQQQLSKKSDQVIEMKKKVEAQKSDCEMLKELIFFLQLGSSSTRDEKLSLMKKLYSDMKRIKDENSRFLSIKTERGIVIANDLKAIGNRLNGILESMSDSLYKSVNRDLSIYQKLDGYFHYCGFSFCGKRIDPKGKICDVGKVVNFGHVEE